MKTPRKSKSTYDAGTRTALGESSWELQSRPINGTAIETSNSLSADTTGPLVGHQQRQESGHLTGASKAGEPPEHPSTAKPNAWAKLINATVKRCAQSVVELGQLLLQARRQLKRGEWTKMFRSGQVTLSLRVAQRFMAIADNPALAKATNSSRLPLSPDALYELAKLSPTDVEAHIASGNITTDLTIAQARALVKRLRGSEEQEVPMDHSKDFDYYYEPASAYLRAKLTGAPPRMLQVVVPELIGVLRGLLRKAQDEAGFGRTPVPPSSPR